MTTRVRKWGHSLALRIPKSFAAEAGLRDDSQVQLTVTAGKLIVEPQADDPPCLDDLLKRVTDENIHREWDTGPAVGKEIW